MTPEEHRQRHIELHQMLDELVADFIGHGALGKNFPSRTTIMELMAWSRRQTICPDPLPGRRGREWSAVQN